MTYNDLIMEGRTYEYSQEYLKLMQESFEIDLMERYIKNQIFLKENAHLLRFSQYKEYLVESVSDETIVMYLKELGMRKGISITAIISRILKFFSGIGKFFMNLFSHLSTTSKNNKRIKDALAKLTFTNEIGNKLVRIHETCYDKLVEMAGSEDNVVYRPHTKQPNDCVIKFKNVAPETDYAIFIGTALSNTEIIISIEDLYNQVDDNPYYPLDITAFEGVEKFIVASDIRGCIDYLESYFNKMKAHRSFTMNVHPLTLSSESKTINRIYEEFTKLFDAVNNATDGGINFEGANFTVDDYMKFSALCNGCITYTMSLYKQYYFVQNFIRKELVDLLKVEFKQEREKVAMKGDGINFGPSIDYDDDLFFFDDVDEEPTVPVGNDGEE